MLKLILIIVLVAFVLFMLLFLICANILNSELDSMMTNDEIGKYIIENEEENKK